MAGLYIHIPFCKKACHYCNFHFSTSLKHKNAFLSALLLEMEQRACYLAGEPIDTVYIGGGTPSLLDAGELAVLLQAVKQHFSVGELLECTLEANPDDISVERVKSWVSIGINRLSIGVQSFFDEDLLYMNRAHRSAQAIEAIRAAQEAGIHNLSTDLIFGYPLLSMEKWKHNIEQMLALNIPHVSCYGMTVEPKTVLSSFIRKGKVPPLDPEQSALQYEYLMERLEEAGFEHYEVSNFARPGMRALHNSRYWNGSRYIGLGPSAHSFNGVSRQWNVANNALYVKGIMHGESYYEHEELSRADRINERVMTGLRIAEGIELRLLQSELTAIEWLSMEAQLAQFVSKGWVWKTEQAIGLTKSGMLFADGIAAEFFILN